MASILSISTDLKSKANSTFEHETLCELV